MLVVCFGLAGLLRTQQTIDLALDGRPVPTLIEPGFDEIRVGDLDGGRIGAYWSWRDQHTRADHPPHGASTDDALRRPVGRGADGLDLFPSSGSGQLTAICPAYPE